MTDIVAPHLSLDARFVADSYPYDQEHRDLDTHLVVRVTAPDTETPRPRVRIVGVIDCSGSMGVDRKLETAKSALSQVLHHLTPEDRMGLVTYESKAQVHLEPSADPVTIASRLQALRPLGSTNMEAGLRLAIDQALVLASEFRSAGGPFEVRVVLVSDGLPNIGETRAELLAALAADLPAGVRVSAIGVGYDCDHDLLAEISRSGGGNYGHAEGGPAIPALIGAEFGSIVEVAATDLSLLVTPRRYVQLAAPLGVAHNVEPAGEGFEIRIPTLLRGETRTFVLPASLQAPGRRHARAVTAAQVTLSDANSETLARPKVFFALSSDESVSPHPELLELVDKAVAAEALRAATQAARRGDFEYAARVISGASQAIQSPSVSAVVNNLSTAFLSFGAYNSHSADVASYSAALGSDSRLLGGSTSFDAAWFRTMGSSYATDSTRTWSLRITDQVEAESAGDE